MTSAPITPRKSIWSVRKVVGFISIALVVGITAVYRFYQPVTHPALLQFDIFDWMNRSKELMLFGKMTAPTSLWLFPTVNAWIARIIGGDLFSVYLFSGATLTTLNVILLGLIARMLWPKRILPVVIMILFYALNTQLLARSVNYLPETMTYTFGLALVYCYLILFLWKTWKIVPVIVALTYLYYHLHQSGLNFLVFSVLAIIAYTTWLAPIRRRWRAAIISVGIMAVVGLFIAVEPLRQQFQFFINGSKNADIAFQGNAIPFEQIVSDYPLLFVIFLTLGAFVVILKLFRKNSADQRLSYVSLLGIALFYFLFLYVLPNLGIYSLVPWRFYTWFSLYGVIIATIGFIAFFDRFNNKRGTVYAVCFLLVVSLFHGGLLPDNMYTADRATLESISKAPIPEGSTVMTTNANHLQTRYSLVGRDIIVREVGSELFRASSATAASQYLKPRLDGRPTYILISKFQLRQRPASLDYWRNSALFDMDLSIFTSRILFNTTFEDDSIKLVEVKYPS